MPTAPEAPVGEHRLRRIMAWRAGHAAARVGSRAAQIKSSERHPVIGRTNHRPGAEQLIEAHLAMKDVAADQPEPAFEVEWRVYLPAEHGLREARCVAVDGGDDRVRGLLALVVPAAPRTKVVTEVLAE